MTLMRCYNLHSGRERIRMALATRERILEAAGRALSRNPNATVDQIAADARVGRATVFRHFESRAGLLRALASRAIAETDRVTRQAAANARTATDTLRLVDAGRCRHRRVLSIPGLGRQALRRAGDRRSLPTADVRIGGLGRSRQAGRLHSSGYPHPMGGGKYRWLDMGGVPSRGRWRTWRGSGPGSCLGDHRGRAFNPKKERVSPFRIDRIDSRFRRRS